MTEEITLETLQSDEARLHKLRRVDMLLDAALEDAKAVENSPVNGHVFHVQHLSAVISEAKRHAAFLAGKAAEYVEKNRTRLTGC